MKHNVAELEKLLADAGDDPILAPQLKQRIQQAKSELNGDKWVPPPNPFFKRYYRSSLDIGCCEVSITAPGGKMPVGDDANDLIEFFKLIIRQIERSRDRAAAAPKVEA